MTWLYAWAILGSAIPLYLIYREGRKLDKLQALLDERHAKGGIKHD